MSNILTELGALNGKASVDLISNTIINSVEYGNLNPLELKIKAKILTDAIGKATKYINDLALDEAAKHGRKGQLFGANFSEVEAGVKYDYAACNDVVYNDLITANNELQELIKERETFLKTIKEPVHIVNNATGELYKINPPIKTSTTTLKITML